MNALSKSLSLAIAAWMLAAGTAWAQEEDDADPLGGVIVDMQVAGGRLGKLQTDKTTQQKQKDAVNKLDGLIKLLEERRGNNGGGGGGMSTDPLEDSKIVSGPGGSGPLHAARRNGNAWGTLPPHKREQILQSMTEGFPAHYQVILERYYRRLAEEKPASEIPEELPTGAVPPGAKRPAAATGAPAATGTAPAAPAAEKSSS